jgi:hypothetical protein
VKVSKAEIKTYTYDIGGLTPEEYRIIQDALDRLSRTGAAGMSSSRMPIPDQKKRDAARAILRSLADGFTATNSDLYDDEDEIEP